MMQYLFLKIGDKKKHWVPATSYINNDHASFIKFMKVTSIWQQVESAERQKTNFPKKISRKCRLVWIRIEHNNDHIRIVRKMQFRSSFKLRFLKIRVLVPWLKPLLKKKRSWFIVNKSILPRKLSSVINNINQDFDADINTARQ